MAAKNRINDHPTGKDFLDVAAELFSAFKAAGIEATVVGGGVCSIYTNNFNQSGDIDFVSLETHARVAKVLDTLGFRQDVSRNFIKENQAVFLDFVGRSSVIGESPVDPKDLAHLKHKGATIRLYSPTLAIMDRLTHFFYYNDPTALTHATLVAKKYPVNLEKIVAWAKNEGEAAKLEIFLNRVRQSQAKPDAYSKKIAAALDRI